MTNLLSPSYKTIWKIAFPLIITTLSTQLMYSFDRLLLARQSCDSATAIAAASMSSMVFVMFCVGVCSITEVFVGQFNGAKRFLDMGKCTWQMIWFALFCSIICLPIALFGAPYLLPQAFLKDGQLFFSTQIIFLWLPGCVAAISGFFVAQGHVKIITFTAIGANIINVILCLILISGVFDLIPPQGVKGAAIATVIAQFFQLIVLLYLFLNKKNRTHFATHKYALHKIMLKDNLRIGIPSASGHMIEIIAWASLATIISNKNAEFYKVVSMAQLAFGLFSFLLEGLKQGVTAFASNLIGAAKNNLIPLLIKNSLFVHLTIIGITAIPLIFFAPTLVKTLLLDPSNLHLEKTLIASLFYVWLYGLLDGFVWVLAGVLTSSGDTKFIMVTNALTSWGFAVLPIYIMLYHGNNLITATSSDILWMAFNFYAFINVALFFWRYKQEKWKDIKISSESKI